MDEITAEEHLAIASAVDAANRLKRLSESLTAGPFVAQPGINCTVKPDSDLWRDGWYKFARRADAYPGRIGGTIAPFSIVQHTTDMLDEDFDALLVATTTRLGAGNAFTFLCGRTPAQGLVQVCPITRNANHAGGPTHGVYAVGGKSLHPNLSSVGIEAHNAGGLRLVGGLWRFVEDGKAHGAPFAPEDVLPDPRRPDRAYHKPTAWQIDTLRKLWGDLELALAPLPHGVVVKAFGEAVQPSIDTESPRLVTHHMLDPQARSDCWPPLAAIAKGYAAAAGY